MRRERIMLAPLLFPWYFVRLTEYSTTYVVCVVVDYGTNGAAGMPQAAALPQAGRAGFLPELHNSLPAFTNSANDYYETT